MRGQRSFLFFSLSPPIPDSSRTITRTPFPYSSQHTPSARKIHFPEQTLHKMAHSRSAIGLRGLRQYPRTQSGTPKKPPERPTFGFSARKVCLQRQEAVPPTFRNTHHLWRAHTHTGTDLPTKVTHKRTDSNTRPFGYAPFCSYTPTSLHTYTPLSHKPPNHHHHHLAPTDTSLPQSVHTNPHPNTQQIHGQPLPGCTHTRAQKNTSTSKPRGPPAGHRKQRIVHTGPPPGL